MDLPVPNPKQEPPRLNAQRARIEAAWAAVIGPVWRSRAAAGLGAVLIGVAALGFAYAADLVAALVADTMRAWAWSALAVTPTIFAVLLWATRRIAPGAVGSGIPQVIAVARVLEDKGLVRLVSLKTAAVKLLLTLGGLVAGASVGREGPTVQIGAAIMVATHRWLRVPLTAGVVIAGGAAGVAAAFNAPLAGVAFAIEELAAAYEQRLAVLVMGGVVLAGLVSQAVAGDYVYFGEVDATLGIRDALLIAPLAGIVGGLAGGAFARALLDLGRWAKAHPIIRAKPVAVAAVCGLGVAFCGILSGGTTWGTGYDQAPGLIEGGQIVWWFTPLKLLASLLTGLSGIPGGIFAPALATGAGLGGLIALPFPHAEGSAIVVVGMIAYFVGVVRAPLTGVVIVSEMTSARGLLLPLFLAAIMADFAAKWVCPERLYDGLARAFLPADWHS